MTVLPRRARASLQVGTLILAMGVFSTAAHAGVSGRVLGPDGKPVAGATVDALARESAEDQGERHAAGRPRTPLVRVRTGADGAFRIETTSPFAWLEARAEGFAPAASTVGDEGPITLTLHRAEPKRGVIRANGKPVAGAVVVWVSGSVEQVARTGADGVYEAPDPETSPAMVQVIHPDFAALDTQLAGKGSTLDRELKKGIAVVGSAVDAAGQPVAGATLYVDGDLPSAKTDARGGFAIPNAPEDWSYVTARADRLAGAASRRSGDVVVTAKPARSVSGVVREAKTGSPLAGATVVATSALGHTVSADTDARGQYVLAGLPPGRYRVYAGRDGFASGPADYMSAEPLDLREAASGRRDFALARQPRLTGRVEDEEHRPVDGALVFLGPKDTPAFYVSEASFGMEGGSTRSNADGSFRLQVPAEGEDAVPFLKDWSITVLKHGYAAAQPDRKTLAAGTPVTIRLTRGVELKGRVTAQGGTPVAGVAVQAAEDGTFGGTMVPMHVVLAGATGDGWTATDASGRFAMQVRPVVHHLSFRKPGLAPKVVRGHDPRGSVPLEVALEPAALVRGRVARADGSGIAGVTVAASQEMRWMASTTVTGPDGAFELADLAPGLYELTATHQALGISLTRTAEAPAGDVQMLLGPAATLRGRVTDAATALPVTRFKLRLSPEEQSGRRDWEVPSEDAAGAFTIADVPVGEVGVVATAAGYAAKREDVTVTAEAEAPELEIALLREAPIAGRVTTEGKAPVPEARVTVEVQDAPERLGATTDDDGAYELRGVPGGTVTLAVQARGYLPEKRTLDTRETTRGDVTLRKGLALRGEVVYQGAGVAQAFVSATSSTQGATSQNAQTDERGRFTLEGLVAGRYTVQGYAEGKGKAKLEDVDVERAGSLRLVLERGATAVLTGTVVGLPEGEDPAFVSVSVVGEDGAAAHGMVDAAHAFRIEDAPAGRVQARATATYLSGTERSSRAVDLALASGAETETLLRFTGDVVITGTVVRDGAPVPGVSVGFAAPDATGSSGRTDARGAYEIAGLEPGTYRVTVNGDNTYFATSHVVAASGEFDIDITGGSVSGRAVRADDGTPVGNVTVSFFRVGENENTPATSVATSAQGTFTARSLHEGPYRLITSKPGYGQVVRAVEVPHGGTADVLLELSEAEGIGVTVVDARDGRALDAIVVVRDLARQIVANQHSGVGPQGELNIPLAPGPYLLSTSAGGYGTVTRSVTSPAQGLRVGLTPGGTLVIESPRDLRGRIRLIQPDGEEYVRCWCNGIAEIQLNGRWTSVENVTPGDYTVELVDAPEGSIRKPVLIREGQTSTVTLE